MGQEAPVSNGTGGNEGGYQEWERIRSCQRTDVMTLKEYVSRFHSAVYHTSQKTNNKNKPSSVDIDDKVLGCLLLDGARIGELERCAITASTGNSLTLKKVEDCLLRLHGQGYLANAGKGAARLPAENSDSIFGAHWLIFVALFLAGLAVRLYNIDKPDSVVFDELHFGRFVKRYRDGKYFFDIHPPLGKLILFVVSKYFCNDPTLDYETVSVPYGETKYVPLRITSSIFGAGVAPILFSICRTLGFSVPASMIPAVMQIVDSLVVIESRLILLDAQLLFFMALCFLCALKLWGTQKRTVKRWFWLLATALSGAASFSVKWTAAPTSLLVAILSAFGWFLPKQGRLDFIEMIAAGVSAIGFYMMTFWFHFKLLPNSGDGDAFMLSEFQAGLIGNEYYNENATIPSFFNSFRWLNVEMFRANQRIDTPHPFESKWYDWIISRRGLLFHYADKFEENSDLSARIYLIVNPIVTLTTVLALFAFTATLLCYYIPKRMNSYLGPSARIRAYVNRGAVFLLGYGLNLLPYLAVTRCTFLYHYIPSLFYAQLAVGNLINVFPIRMQWKSFIVISGLVIAAFWYWSPWIYGIPISSLAQYDRRLLGKSWE